MREGRAISLVQGYAIVDDNALPRASQRLRKWPRKRDTIGTPMSHCRVDADGVAAEWVEATVATEGQLTLVFFLGDDQTGSPLAQARPAAEKLAAASGARVLTVACGSAPLRTAAHSVEAALRAYAWLLREGCDLTRVTFVSDSSNGSVVRDILTAATLRGLPIPTSPISRASGAGVGVTLDLASWTAPV